MSPHYFIRPFYYAAITIFIVASVIIAHDTGGQREVVSVPQVKAAATVLQASDVANGDEEIILNELEGFTSEDGTQLEDLEPTQTLIMYVLLEDTDEEHIITIKEVGNNQIVTSLAATPIATGATAVYDVNQDGTNDLELYVRSTEGNMADVTLRQLNAPAASPTTTTSSSGANTEGNNSASPATTPSTKKSKPLTSQPWLLYGGTAVGIIVFFMLILLATRRHAQGAAYQSYNDPDIRR